MSPWNRTIRPKQPQKETLYLDQILFTDTNQNPKTPRNPKTPLAEYPTCNGSYSKISRCFRERREKHLGQLLNHGHRAHATDYIYRALEANGHGWSRSMFQIVDASTLRQMFGYCSRRAHYVLKWPSEKVMKTKKNLEYNLKKEDREIKDLKEILASEHKSWRRKEREDYSRHKNLLIQFIMYELDGKREEYDALSSSELSRKARKAVEKRMDRHACSS